MANRCLSSGTFLTFISGNFHFHSRTTYSYNAEAQIYAPSSVASYFDSQGGGAQVTTVVSTPTAIPSHSMVGIAMDVGGSQIISSSGAYLIHGGLDNSRHSLSHTSRSSPATVCIEHYASLLSCFLFVVNI